MSMPDRPPRYRAYLLRLWQEGQQEEERPRDWRFSLEDPHTGKRYAFASLERLIAFLRQHTAGHDGPGTENAELSGE